MPRRGVRSADRYIVEHTKAAAAGALASAVAAVAPEADLPFAGALRREGAAARLEAALRAACVGDAAARVRRASG